MEAKVELNEGNIESLGYNKTSECSLKIKRFHCLHHRRCRREVCHLHRLSLVQPPHQWMYRHHLWREHHRQRRMWLLLLRQSIRSTPQRQRRLFRPLPSRCPTWPPGPRPRSLPRPCPPRAPRRTALPSSHQCNRVCCRQRDPRRWSVSHRTSHRIYHPNRHPRLRLHPRPTPHKDTRTIPRRTICNLWSTTKSESAR